MKKFALFGYTEYEDPDEFEGDVFVRLREVTLVAYPRTLRIIADFLDKSANEIEEWGQDFGHQHLGFYDREIGHEPSFVVMPPHPSELD